MAARSAYDEITERTHVLAPADEHERMIAMMVTPGCTTYLQLGDGLVSARRVGLEGHPVDEQVVEYRLDLLTTAGLKNAPPRTRRAPAPAGR